MGLKHIGLFTVALQNNSIYQHFAEFNKHYINFQHKSGYKIKLLTFYSMNSVIKSAQEKRLCIEGYHSEKFIDTVKVLKNWVVE